MTDTGLVIIAVALGFAGGLGLALALLARPVRFLEDLLDELFTQRRRLEALLGELETEQEPRPPTSN